MAEGYFPLYRQIQEHWLWEDTPFSKGQAWVDLLLSANHCDTKFAQGNEIIEAKRGQVVTSEVKLAKRWGWSRHKVMDFIKLLETDKMLVKNSDRKRTYLTLCNYKDFNDLPDNKRTSEGQGRDTINNVNNNNKDITPSDKPKKKTVFDHDSKPYQCAQFLDEYIRENFPNKHPADELTLQKWAAEFDKTNRIDKYDWDLILSVLEFSQKEKFWKTVILSGSKFRDKFVTLMAQMGGNR